MLPSPSVQFAVCTVQYRQKCYLLLLFSLQSVRYSTGRNVTFSFFPVCSAYGTAELGPSIVLTMKLLHIPVIKDTKFIYCLFKLMQAVIKLWRKIQPPPNRFQYNRWQRRICTLSVQLYSDVTIVHSVFVSDKISNNCDIFRYKCLSYS